MTDIKHHKITSLSKGDVERTKRRKEDTDDLFELMELLFYAYRDFVSEPDEILSRHGFGRAHHRVIHFVGRNPDLRVADLLTILRITKQSLGRVLKQLVEEGFIIQTEGKNDRRERRLRLTPKGKELGRKLAAPQLGRITRALEKSGHASQQNFQNFLKNMID